MSLNEPNPLPGDGHAATLRHMHLFHAACDLESATYAARKAREGLQRATAARLSWKERMEDAKLKVHSSDRSRLRLEFARWALNDADRNVDEKLTDYQAALSRLEAAGRNTAPADHHEVPSYVRHRARKAIALADAFGNKVAMDATLHDGLKRPALPELSPEVEVQEFVTHSGEELRTKVLDPLEPVEKHEAPHAVLVPVEDYTSPREEYSVEEAELLAHLEDASRREYPSLYADRMDENLAPVCPECRDGKHGNCDGTAWDDHEDAPASCSCLTCEAKLRENGEAGR